MSSARAGVRVRVRRSFAALAALASTTVLTSACGAISTGVPAADTPPAAVSDALDPEAPLDELLAELVARWRGLDQRVIDEVATEPLARLEEVWALAEPLIRDEHPNALFGFQQAMDLARSAVEWTRPADASKGYRLAVDLVDDLIDR